MNTHLRLGRVSQSLAILFLGFGLVACTTQEAKPDAGTGGRTGGGSGGTTTVGTGGAGGAGGGQYAIVDGTTCLPPSASGLITDFTYLVPDAGAPDGGDGGGAVAVTDQVRFGDDVTALSGGEFYYPNATSTSMYKIVSDVTGGNWHITGSVGDYSGLGLYYDSCSRLNVSAAAFKGISFTISGTVQGGSLTFEVDTLKDTIAASWLNTHTGTAAVTDPGHCIPGPTAVNQYAQSDCVEPTKAIAVTSTPTTVNVLWSDFTTGKPEPAVTPSDIVGIRWVLPNPGGVGTPSVAPYPLDIVIDNLSFIPQ